MQWVTRSATNLRSAWAQATFTVGINIKTELMRWGCNVICNSMHYTANASFDDHDGVKQKEFPHCYCTSDNNDSSADPFCERRSWESADDIMITKNGPINLREWNSSLTEMQPPLSKNEHLRKQFVKLHMYMKDENGKKSVANLEQTEMTKSKRLAESHPEKMINKIESTTTTPSFIEEPKSEESQEEEEWEELETEKCKLTNEELHRRELELRRKVMERNYNSYEEFVIAEFGNDNEQLQSNTDSREFASKSIQRCNLNTSEEEDSDYESESADCNNDICLPHFMQMHTTNDSNAEIKECRAESTAERQKSVPIALTNELALPEQYKRKHVVLHKLGPAHGHEKLSLTDPLYWNENDVILFLHLFEQPTSQPEIGNTNSVDTRKTMDDAAMVQAFEIAKVNGSLLLDTVTPPTLFRIMRRWHNRRKMALEELHNLQANSEQGENVSRNTSGSNLSDKIVQKHIEKLDEAVSSLTS